MFIIVHQLSLSSIKVSRITINFICSLICTNSDAKHVHPTKNCSWYFTPKQSDISKVLKADLQNKFNLNFKFSSKLKYNIFPRPHFKIGDSNIYDDKNEISKVNNLKIFISLNNFFSLNDIEIRDLIIDNANFDLNQN